MSDLPAIQPERPRLPNVVRHLEPERLLREHGSAIKAAFAEQFDRHSLQTASGVQDIEMALSKVPTIRVLLDLVEALTQALGAKPSRSVNAVSVAMLVDSRIRQPSNLAMYVEALTYDLADLGYPPCVVVSACQRLRREAVFAPEIAEVLKLCAELQGTYRSTARVAERLAADRQDAEQRLALTLEAERKGPRPTRYPAPRADAQPGDPDW